MSSLGVNVSASGLANPDELRAAGTTKARIPLWPEYTMRAIVKVLVNGGIDVLPCADAKTFSVANDPHEVALYWHQRIGDLCPAVQWGSNEFDQVGPTSSTAAEKVVYEQLWTARRVFKTHTLVGPNLASGQPERWTKRLDDLVDVVALSRYPDVPEKMIDGLSGYARFGKPLWFGEFPIWGEAWVTEALRLSQRAYVYCWKSWWQDEERNWKDGLIGLDGTPTWRMDLFTRYAEADMATTAELEAKIKLLEQQQSLTVDLAARILSGKWDEGAESAEALLRAIAPKYKDFEAVRFR